MRRDEFTVGWICALSHELAASRAMLDEEYDTVEDGDIHDDNVYTWGRIGGHRIVMACLPAGKYGTESAATVAKDMIRSYPSLRFGLMVGIGGGVTTTENDIRLGDVVVSKPTGTHGGVVQYDLGKVLPGGVFERKGASNKPPLVLLNALQKLRSEHDMREPKIAENLERMRTRFPRMKIDYGRPGASQDILYLSECRHSTSTSCEKCGQHEESRRKTRYDAQGQLDEQPHIHYGLIASGNRVIASAEERDRVRAEEEILCFEMEAAGLMDAFPCLVIRGICDYADSYNRDGWQKYAAAAAASYARELLGVISPGAVERTAKAQDVADVAVVEKSNLFGDANRGFQADVISGPITNNYYNNANSPYFNAHTTDREQATQLAQQAMGSTADSAVQRDKPVKLLSTIPIPRDDKFVERKGVLEQLNAVFDLSMHNRRAALYGLGGIGKSQLAIEYAFQTLEQRPGTAAFWIYASDITRILQSFRDIAIKLKLPGHDDPKTNIAAMVRRWLDDESNGPWIVIFDNVDDVDVLEQSYPDLHGIEPTDIEHRRLLDYVPQTSQGKVLVTSRDRSAAYSVVGDYDRLVLVDRMDEAESLELLKTKVPMNAQNLEDAKVLVKLLEYIPLAVTQAGAYIREQESLISIADYCADFSANESDQSALLNEEAKDLRRDPSVPNSVIVTWEISFQLIRRRQSQAADLLSLLTMFSRQNIPEELVRSEDRLDFRRAVKVLDSFSFVTITKEADRILFGLHRLVQLATLKWLENTEVVEYWRRRAVDAVAAILPFRKYESWEECDRLLPHAEKVVEYQSAIRETELQRGAVTCKIACHYSSVGNFEVAVERAEECLVIYLRYLREEDQQMLVGKDVLASTYCDQGRWDEAEALEVEVTETRKKKLGLDHPDTLISMGNLASTYWNQGRWDEAEALEVEVTETRKKKLGIGHPDTLTSMGNLASTYRNQGRWDEAEALEVEVTETRKKKLGLGHPDTLISMGNLASTYWNQGRWDEAEALEVQVMETMEKKLGLDHPDTLTIMNNLASTYWNQGRWDEAEALQVEVTETSKKKLGLDHPDTLISMNNLASTYWNQGRWDEAEALHVEATETAKKNLGLDHPSTLISMSNLAFTLKKSGRACEAITLMEEVVRKSLIRPGKDHPATLMRSTALGAWKSLCEEA